MASDSDDKAPGREPRPLGAPTDLMRPTGRLAPRVPVPGRTRARRRMARRIAVGLVAAAVLVAAFLLVPRLTS